MSDNKKYYYLKVKETFFDSEEMKVLESMTNGYKYQNLYFRLCLLSLKSDGLLMFKNILPYDLEMLSTVLRVDIDTARTGIEIFQKIGLVSRLDNGTIFMTDIQSLIGRSSTEAERIKAYREKTKQLGCNNSVQMYEQCTPELELELEKELEKEIDLEKKIQKKEEKTFKKPTQEEVIQYVLEKGLVINPYDFFNYYEKLDWKDNQGNKVKSWKGKAVTWDTRELKKNQNSKPYVFHSETSSPRKSVTCPRCGAEVIAGLCTKCRIPIDSDGKELT